MNSKPTKGVGHFEENKFSVGGRQFLLDCCPNLMKTYNFGQNADNKRQFKNKNEQYCTVRLFNFKDAKTFCQFSVCDCLYFLPFKCPCLKRIIMQKMCLEMAKVFKKILKGFKFVGKPMLIQMLA